MIPVNVTMCFVNLDKFLIKDRFCANKEFTRRRIFAPYNRGTAIDLRRNLTISQEPIKDRKITRQDGIFGVLEMCVFHTISMAQNKGQIKQVCVGCSTVHHQ